jgi:hypothetical protein
MPRRRKPRFFTCPHCGAHVRVGAAACRECGSDAESGWSEDAESWTSDPDAGYTGDDDFDYDEFVRDEFPEQAEGPSPGGWKRWAIAVIVALLCLAMLMLF